MADKIDALFEDLQARGFAKDKTRDDFRKYMLAPGAQGYQNRKDFFDDFKGQGMTDLNSYEDFANLLGLRAAKPTQQYNPESDSTGAGVGAAIGKTATELAQKPINPNLAESVQQTIRGVNEGFDQFQGNLESYYKQKPLGRGVAKGKQRWNQDTGEFEQTYLTGAGTEHTSQREAEDIQKMWVGDERTQLRKKAEFADDELERALAEREKLRYANPNDPKVAQAIENNEAYIQQLQRNDTRLRASEMEINDELADIRRAEEENAQRIKASEPSWWDDFRKNFAAGMMTSVAPDLGQDLGSVKHQMALSGAFGSEQKDVAKELDVLKARKRLAEDAKSIINDIRLDQKMEGWGLARAGMKVAETALNPNTWDWGKGELETDLAIAEAVIKADSGLGISDNERKLLDTWAKNTAIQSQFGEQLSGWTKSGMVTGESLPFMLEMAMNPAAGLGKGATEKIAQYASKKAAMRFLKEGIEKFGKEEGEKWAKRKGAEYLRNHMKGLMAKKIATRAVGDITAAEVMASTSGSMRVMDDAIKRMTGDVDIELADNGDVYYNGTKAETKDNPTIAVLKALGSTGIENWSEMAGEYMGFLNDFFGKAIGRAVVGKQGRKALDIVGNVEGVTLNKAQKFIYELAAGKGIGAFSEGLGKFAKQTQWHGVVGEYLEEVIGNIANAATVGDMTFDTAKDTGVFNLEQNIDTFCGVALMGGFMSALHTGGFIGHRIKYSPDRVSNANAQLFGEENWNDIKAMIDNSHKDPRELNDALTYLLRGKKTDSNGMALGDIYNNKEKEAILKYTQAVLEKDGADMVNYQPRMYSSTVEETNGADGKKQYVVSSFDKYGTAISQQAFDTEDEAQAFEGELKMQQQQKDYNDYLDMSSKLSYAESADLVDQFMGRMGASEMSDEVYAQTMADINDSNSELGKQFQKFKNDAIIEKARANQEAIAQFEQDMGWEQGTVKWLSEQDPMQMDNEGLEMMDTAREFLESLAYTAGEVHVEHEQQKGAEAGQSVVRQVISQEVPIDPNNNEGQQIKDQFQAAESAYNQMLANDKTGDIVSELKDMETKGFSPQEILSSLETFTPQQRRIVADYYNAKAKWESYIETAANEIDHVAHRDRERRTFKGTINGQPNYTTLVTVTDEEGNSYYLASGNISADTSGRVTDSDSGLIIAVDANGNFVQLNDKNLTVTPIGQPLDGYEAQRREELQKQVTFVTDSNGTMDPALQQQPGTEQGGNQDNAGGEAGGTNTGANEPSATALSKIPVDEKGQPLYTQASPEDTYDALVEQVGEQGASTIAQSELNDARKRLEKLTKDLAEGKVKGNTAQEKIVNMQQMQQAIQSEQNNIAHWESVLNVPVERKKNTPPPAPPAPVVTAKQFIDRMEAAGTHKEVDDIFTEGLKAGIPENELMPTYTRRHWEIDNKDVPEYRYDTPEAARKRGFKIVEGQRIDRQEEKPMPQGMEVEVQYSTKDKVKGHLTVSELGEVQGSHLVNGQRNQKNFIPEAQPKAEFGSDRQAAAQSNASEANFRPELMLTFNGTQSAYSGSTTQTNRRGEVIQGNGRRNLAEFIYAPGNEAVARRYKEFLMTHAEELGTTAEAIAQMEKPFAHIVLDVSDEEAIRLGQFTAADLETGGKKIPEVASTATKLGDKFSNLANIVLRHEDPDASLAERIEANADDAVRWLNQGGYINNTEAKTLLEDKAAARQFIKDLLTDTLFSGASPELRTMFYELPKNIQSAIVSVIGREVTTIPLTSILKDIQESIVAYHELMVSSPHFAGVKGRSYEDRKRAATAAVNDWLRQINIDGTLNKDKFSNFALELAKLYRCLTDQKTLAGRLRDYYDLVSGSTRQLGMFDEPGTTGAMTREEAIKQIFNVEYGRQGTVPLASDNQTGQSGQQGGPDRPQGGERREGEGGPSDNRGGDTGNGEEVSANSSSESTEQKIWKAVDWLNGKYGYTFKDAGAFIRFYARKGKAKGDKWIKDKFPPKAANELIESIAALAKQAQAHYRRQTSIDGIDERHKREYDEYIKPLLGLSDEQLQQMAKKKEDSVGGDLAKLSGDLEYSAIKNVLVQREIERGRKDAKIFIQNTLDDEDVTFVDKATFEEIDKLQRLIDEYGIDDAGGNIEKYVKELRKKYPAEKKIDTSNPIEAIEQAAQSFKEEKEKKPKSNNKVFTDEAHEEVLKKLRAKFNNLNAGFDPEIALLMLQDAGYHIEKGARKIAECAKAMIEELGDFVRPYIKSAYNAVRDYPGMEEIAKEMSPFAEVEAFDPLNFDNVPDNTVNVNKQENNEPEKDLSLQSETINTEENGLEQSTSNVRPGGQRDGNNEGKPSERVRQGAQQEGGGLDGQGQAEGREGVGESDIRPAGRLQRLNLNNNHEERGTESAPTSTVGRIEANIEAIELMQKLVEDGRPATEEEKKILRQFSGWGGLGAAFDNPVYENKLRELLGDAAYDQAQMSRNSAYFTPAKIIDAMWDVAKALGFKGGNVLEGSAGVGKIIGLMPTELSENSNIQAVEIDETTGNILKLLYPDAQVDVQGFEDTKIPNGSIDLAITNVPFVTGLRVQDTTGDKDLSKMFHDIHDFCIAKNIRKLKEGGIGIFITSNGTLDNSQKLRDWIISEGDADVVGAFRLNNKTFGGTGTTSDIIVVRRRVNGQKSPNAIDVSLPAAVRGVEYNTGETKKVKGQEVPVIKKLSMDYNGYFVEHPEHMGGEMVFNFEIGETYRPTSKTLTPVSVNQDERLNAWVDEMSKKDWSKEASAETSEPEKPQYEKYGEGVKEGSLILDSKGNICIAQYGEAVPLGVNDKKVKGRSKQECLKDYNAIKNALNEVLNYQVEHEDNDGLQPLLDKLNKAFNQFVAKYGHFHNNTAISFLRNDVDYASVGALETYKEKTDKDGNKTPIYGKADVFSKRVVEKEKEPQPKTIEDGVIASIYKYGGIDIPYIAQQLGISEEEAKEEILDKGLGFENPDTTQVEVNFVYLSGNVREKLEKAKANNVNGKYAKNISALEKKIPADIPAHLIEFNLGSTWIDKELYKEFFKEKTGKNATFNDANGTWFLGYNEDYTPKDAEGAVFSELCDKTILTSQLIEAAMTGRTIKVQKTEKGWDGKTETITDNEATQACAARIDELKQDFKDWARAKMQAEPEWAEKIEKAYNDQFNNYVPLSIPNEFAPTHFGGQNKSISMREHQSKAVIKGITQPIMFAHGVGAGKTFTLIATAMEMRRIGTAKKPMIVVQNATVGQFTESAKELYPAAKILTMDEKDHSEAARKQFYAKIKYNDWDLIIVPQSVLDKIPDSPDRQLAYINEKIQEKERILMLLEEDPSNWAVVNRLRKELDEMYDEEYNLTEASAARSEKKKKRDEKKRAVAKQNAAVRAKEQLDRSVDDVEDFDDMEIDAILVDEAHNYKKLGFGSVMQRVKGVDTGSSKKCASLLLKTRAVLEKSHGKNVVFATGTPVSNTAAEVWTFMRYLMPEEKMEEYGIKFFDDFARNFGNVQQMLEFTTSGKFKENNRFAGYVNMPELARIWASIADTVEVQDAKEVKEKLPEIEGGKATDIYLPQTKALRSVMKFVRQELERYEHMSGKEKKANSFIPLVMYGIAKAAAVDARLVDSTAADEPQSKTNEAVRQTLRSLEETKEYNGTIAIFADNYQNKQSGFNLYEDIKKKLVAQGVPSEQIAIIRSDMSDKKKLDIFDKVNSGEIRVVMGSTQTLGTGVNIQERLHTLIHMDAPNRPMDYTQRNGRIERQGNLHKEWGIPVRILRFGVEDSLDVTAYQRLKTKGAIADSVMKGDKLLQNAMDSRVLEEEEDVFGDTVAQLSGSEYAMLKNQAEKEVRKLEARYKQWEADQIFVHAQMPRLLGQSDASRLRMEKAEKNLATVEKAMKEPLKIEINGQSYDSLDAMADFFKDYNSKIKAVEDEIRKSGVVQSQERKLTITINGIPFEFKTIITGSRSHEKGKIKFSTMRQTTFNNEDLIGSERNAKGGYIKNGVEEILNDYLSGNDYREIIETEKNSIARNEAQIKMLEERSGKEFTEGEALEKARERLEEYTQKMKEEMEAKEAKYKEMDSEVEASDSVTMSDEDEDSDAPKRMITTHDPMEAISQAAESWRRENKKESNNHKNGRNVPEDVDKNLSLQIEEAFDKAIEEETKDLSPEDRKWVLENLNKEMAYIANISEEDSEFTDDNGDIRKVGGLASRRDYHSKKAGDEVQSRQGRKSNTSGHVQERQGDQGDSGNGRTAKESLHRLSVRAIDREMRYREARANALRAKYNIDSRGTISEEDLIRMFNDFNSNESLNPIFEAALKVMRTIGARYFTGPLDAFTLGESAMSKRRIKIDFDKMTFTANSNQTNAGTILHELLHPATNHAMTLYNLGGKYKDMLTPQQQEAIKEIQDLYDEAKSHPEWFSEGKDTYGIKKDEFEFTSEASNTKFRSELSPSKSFLQRLWNAIRKFLHLGKDVPTRVERLDKAILDLMKDMTYNQYMTVVRDGLGLVTKDGHLANGVKHSVVTDKNLVERLEKEPKITVYRAMQLQDGKLYPPMAAKINGKWQDPLPLGEWSQADEHPELVNKDGKFDLDKGNGKKVSGVVYAPYMHGSTTMLNDQFKEAQDRPELVVVEAEMPESELTSEYQAEKSPRKTGMLDWKAGTIQGQLTGTRQVMLSRWVKPVRIVPSSEVAASIKQMIEGQVDVMPTNVVTPEQREELEKLGVRFVKTNNKEIIQEGEHKGEQYSTAYGKKSKKSDVRKSEGTHLVDPMEIIEESADRFRRGRDNAANEEASPEYSAKKVYHDRIYNKLFVITEAFQDAMLSLKNAINAIARDKDIPDSQNPYMAENLMHGKVKNQMDEFNRNYKDPLMDTIKKILKATGMNYGDIDRYVYTKSGLERNREFFVRDWLEAERKRTIREYEELNEQEQEIYQKMANGIETKFEDGDITEEQKNKMLNDAVQEAHDRYINDLEQEWLKTKRTAFEKLNNGQIDFKGYLEELTDFIQREIGDYDPNKSDYSGFRDMFGDDNGKYDEADIIEDLMKTEEEIGAGNVGTLWNQIREANRYSLERYREAGMRTDEQIDKIEQMFNFYVPMRGFANETGEDMYQYMTNPDENGVRHLGGLLKHAKGRKSEAEYPIATMFAMSYKTISDCEQNLVNQKLYRLCQANPNDLIVLSDAWAKYNEQTQTWEESMPEIPDNATEEEARRITLDWLHDMQELAKEGKAKKIKGTPKFDYMPKDPKKKAEHVIEVRMNGQKKLMTVVGNPRLAQALNGQLRFKGALGKVSSAYAKLKNFMASTFTSWSPTFAMRNMWRDWTHFRMMLSVREGEGYAKAANKYYKETLPRPYHGKKNGEKKEGMVELFKKYRAGTLDMSKEVERDFQDFMDNGGTTGFVFMQKLDELQKEMENLTKDMDTEAKIKVGKYTISFKKPKKLQKAIELNDKVIKTLFDSIEAYNEAVENNARFATFRASRHYAGRTKSRSAYDAKEITVNFNRKGAGKNTASFKNRKGEVPLAAQVAGATAQTFGEGRVFFNATLQAIATTFKNFRNPDGSLNKPYIAKWAARYASIPFAFGFMMPLINKALASIFGGGDDDDPYANLPDWVRRNNLCLYIGNDNFITIPIGQELAAFLALGDIAAGLTYRPELQPVDKDWMDEVMSVLNTFSPIEIEQKVTKGGLFSKDWLDELAGKAFSVLTPIISVSQNRSWTGRQIFREDKNKKDAWVPEYQKAYSGTNPLLMSATKGLHELGGGNERKRGAEWSEWNPGMLQYLWEQYTGGPGKTLAGIISSGRDAIEFGKQLAGKDGEPDFNIKKVEGIKAFVTQGDDRTAFYRTKAKFNKYEKDAERYAYENDIVNLEKQEKAGDPVATLKLERLKKGVDFTRFDIIREANRQNKKEGKIGLDDFRRDMYKLTGNERKKAETWYNNEVKKLVDKLDKVQDIQ